VAARAWRQAGGINRCAAPGGGGREATSGILAGGSAASKIAVSRHQYASALQNIKHSNFTIRAGLDG